MQLAPTVNGVLVYSTMREVNPPLRRLVDPPKLTKAQRELAHQMRCRERGCLRCQ